MGAQYAAAAATWNQLFREFLYAEEQAAAGEAAAAVVGAMRYGGPLVAVAASSRQLAAVGVW
jgi:hypothetical protein